MTRESPTCPKCGAELAFRLGEYECPACGYIAPKQATPAPAPSDEPPDYGGVHRARLLTPPPPSAPPPPLFSTLSARVDEPDNSGRSLGGEKLTFVTVFTVLNLAVGIGMSLLSGVGAGGLGAAAGNVVGGIVSTVVGTAFSALCIGFVLYYDADCVRQACLFCAGISGVLLAISIVAALYFAQVVPALLALPDAVLALWLASILYRDRRSEE